MQGSEVVITQENIRSGQRLRGDCSDDRSWVGSAL